MDPAGAAGAPNNEVAGALLALGNNADGLLEGEEIERTRQDSPALVDWIVRQNYTNEHMLQYLDEKGKKTFQKFAPTLVELGKRKDYPEAMLDEMYGKLYRWNIRYPITDNRLPSVLQQMPVPNFFSCGGRMVLQIRYVREMCAFTL
jgi:hypothetical protein